MELIRQIGKSENLSDEDIDKVIESADHKEGIPSIDVFTTEQRLELMTNLVLVMKIDGIIHKNDLIIYLSIIQTYVLIQNLVQKKIY